MSADGPRIWVVDDSAAIRETLAVVLGDAYEVHTSTVDEFQREPNRIPEVALLVLGDAAAELAPPQTQFPPILWLLGPHRSAPPTIAASAVLPRQFNPTELRTQVHLLLSTRVSQPPPGSAAGILEYPVFPADAIVLARRAATTRLPTLICGEPGTGKARLARAIHLGRREGRFVSLSARQCTRAALLDAARLAPGNLTVFVNDVRELSAEGEQLLGEILECSGCSTDAGWHDVRLICATAQNLEGLSGSPLDRDLFYRLSVLPISLLPLRERSDDIPALTAYLSDRLSEALSTGTVTFTPRAMERLCHYLWFGNLAEFETVLTRSIALATSTSIDTADLLFGYGRIATRSRHVAPPAQPAEQVPAEPATGEAVDLIINELAHEFKNPMVTIKTIAQHLERLLVDEKGREQVARLTGEAVDRMDRVLDNLLQFTSFRTPVPQTTALNALLTPALTDLAPLLSERRVTLDYQVAEEFPLFVDTQQITYAFDNLLRAIARDLPEGQTLAVHPGRGGPVVQIEWSGGNQLATKLADFLDHHTNGHGTPLPIGMLFARTLIARNGGRLDIETGADQSVVTVWLPNSEGALAEHGKASNPRR